MNKDYIGEQWKTIKFDFEYTNPGTIEVSNFGRIRTHNKISKGNFLTGSMINGYRIIRLKLYSPRDPLLEQQFQTMQQQIFKFAREIKEMKLRLAELPETDAAYEKKKTEIEAAVQLHGSLKKNLSKKFAADLRKRTINYHSLIHRLVATHFCKKPSEQHNVVAHLDFEKLNNRSTNLVWMTTEENEVHRQKSPLVIAEKLVRRSRLHDGSKVAKLTITRVMLLKKMLNQGKPMRTLVKQFKITETQIRRIKKGENWADIKAQA